MNAQGGLEVGFHGEFREIVAERADRPHRGVRGRPTGTRARRWNIVDAGPRTTGGQGCGCGWSSRPSEIRDMIIESGMEGGMQEGMDMLEEVAVELR